jgi:hypothetical protein
LLSLAISPEPTCGACRLPCVGRGGRRTSRTRHRPSSRLPPQGYGATFCVPYPYPPSRPPPFGRPPSGPWSPLDRRHARQPYRAGASGPSSCAAGSSGSFGFVERGCILAPRNRWACARFALVPPRPLGGQLSSGCKAAPHKSGCLRCLSIPVLSSPGVKPTRRSGLKTTPRRAPRVHMDALALACAKLSGVSPEVFAPPRLLQR